jgi:hypothetical protein
VPTLLQLTLHEIDVMLERGVSLSSAVRLAATIC